MPPRYILDSHIHLWPSSSTSPTNHAWMTPGHQLAKRHAITEYKSVIASSSSSSSCSSTHPPSPSFIYVETDRYLATSAPVIAADETDEAKLRNQLSEWAKEPLSELKFLRRIVSGSPEDGDGFSSTSSTADNNDDDAACLKGAVIWAPFHLSPALFDMYLRIAEHVAGPALWARVVGFRHLLQGKGEGAVKALVQSEDWLGNIVSLGRGRGGRGWAFDVGVDVHRDGVGVVEVIEGMVGEVRRREKEREENSSSSSSNRGSGIEQHGHVRFILNHLCKPPLPFSDPNSAQIFSRWRSAVTRLSSDPAVYMKFSGAFNEFNDTFPTPNTVPALLDAARPFFHVVFACFPNRLMFGSDWPVCNVGGPQGEQGNWAFWVAVVEACLDERGAGEEERESVWWRAGERAYGVEV